MFPSRAPGYSSFFISGLLSPPSSSPASIRSYASVDVPPRRGSLPIDSPPSYMSSVAADDASMFYFTLQPRRDREQFLSFLSLDLAESQSLRSHSIIRRKSSLRRDYTDPPYPVDWMESIPDSPFLLPPASPRSPVGSPVGPRSPKSPSTPSRALPSPKPAPASSLPNVPPSPRSQTLEVNTSRTPTPVLIQSVPQRKASILSQATRASATTSTVSTRYRRTRRNKALACLEGRRPPPRPISTGNFMSLSEDEEEEEEPLRSPSLDEEDEDVDEDIDLSLSNDQLIMLIARLEDGDVHSAPVSPVSSVPSKPPSKASSRERERSSRSSPSTRRRKSAKGLKSFMDFHNDEDLSPWSWRSFIEVAT